MLRSTDWPRVSIADLCESIVDCVNKTAAVVDYPTPYKMIRTTNVRDGWVDLSSVRYVDELTFEKWTRRQKPRRGDVILTREAPLGEVGLLRSDESVFLGQRLVAYRTDPEKLDNRFLLYAMLGDDMQGQIRSMGSGATVEHMRVPDCEKLTLKLPAIDVQRRIASVLAAYDDLIENNTRRIAILEEMARRIYEEWFIHFRFPGHEGVRITATDSGLVPKGWRFGALGDLVDDVRDGVNPDAVPPETAYVGLEHMPRRSIALAEWGRAADVSSTKLRFRGGDILFGKIRPYFHKVAVAPVAGVASSDAIVIRAKRMQDFGLALSVVSSDAFVAHATQTSNGTKMPRANWSVLRQYPVPIPPPELHKRFEAFMAGIVAAVNYHVLRNRNLRATRDLLLPKLISGELDVSAILEPQTQPE